MRDTAANVNRENCTVGEKWGIWHPFGAAAAFFGLWIVALVVLTGAFNPILVNSFSSNPALLRLVLEAESLISVVIPAIVCPLALGRLGHGAFELRRCVGKEVCSAMDDAPHRSVRVDSRFAFGGFLHSAGAFVGGMLGGILWFAFACIALSAAGLMTVGASVSVPALPVWVAACAINAEFQEILVRGYAFDAISRGGGVVVATVATTLVMPTGPPILRSTTTFAGWCSLCA